MTTDVRYKNALEYELQSIVRDMKSISPLTSTYGKLQARRKEIWRLLAIVKKTS